MNDELSYEKDGEAMTPIEQAASDEVVAENSVSALAGSTGPVKVFDADSTAEAEILRSVLEAEGIAAIAQSVPGSSLDQVFFGETFHAIVLVSAEDEQKALQVIDAYTTTGQISKQEDV